MDQNTTNINELPIENNPPENREMPLDIPNINDRNNVMHNEEPNKKVRFDNVEHVQHNFSEQNKIIIFASTLFLLFNDIKVKNYIMTLLVTIFGGTLKLQSGGISKIGLLAYSIIYGLSLFILVNGIEIIIDKYS